ncbi:hypothetical protein LTR17_004411 [Elasticomyces elasticus]|nr:hypothetical protein LTR17_004411 [Elasticomyces elasticus]
MSNFAQRPALGQNVSIGALYDARTDQFLPDRLFKQDLPGAAFQMIGQHKVEVTATYGDTFRTRFEKLGISSNLAGSILAESVRYRGASRYLAEPREGCFIHAALHHTLSTCVQTINFQFSSLPDHLETTVVANPNATHMVTGIEWGSKTVISVRTYASAAERASLTRQLETRFATLVSAVEALAVATDMSISGLVQRIDATLAAEITAYSEMFEEDDGVLLDNLQDAYEFLRLMPLQVRCENEGKGWPITYTLLPVEMLSYMLSVQAPLTKQTVTIAPEILDSCFCLFDDYLTCERKLDQHQTGSRRNAQYLPPSGRNSLHDRLCKLELAKQHFKEEIAHALSLAKSGQLEPGTPRMVLNKYSKGDLSPEKLGDITMFNGEALDFIRVAVSVGAWYVGYNGAKLEHVLSKNLQSEAYVFFFSPRLMTDNPTWEANLILLSELLRKHSSATVLVIVDCEATSSPLDKVRITHYQDSREPIVDLLAHRRFMANKCVAMCDQQTLETDNIERPIKRRHIAIACPGTKCSVAKVQEWLCPRCLAPVEYGFTDRYIYCDCGRSLYSNFVFKCSGSMHGSNYMTCDPQRLLRSLDQLVQTNYINILILGETGVGKSTFINAMVNYLEFETLDEAIDAEKLNYVIPCSFSTQLMDRKNLSRPIEEKQVKIGSSDDEHDGSKGDSATQKTTVYPVTFRSGDTTQTVRLIDTPGIGDSRGVDVDRQNISDILSTLSGYDTVNGILILLKSNNARMSITFRYCLKELLTHLHQNAAANMAFGFTNTRISNYTPGDTYGPLKALLQQHPNDGLCLTTPTTYCFDSESFRYLAAYKSDVIMENKLDFDRSWEHSQRETSRLMGHFKTITPHEVKNTISLNGARELIFDLMKPLADISQTININIGLVKDSVEALKDSRTRGDELRNVLHVQKVQMNAEPLQKPRTVCGDQACTDVRDDGKGQNNMVIVYKEHCHAECHLRGVQAEVVAHPGLIKCSAFQGKDTCLRCGHHWQQHLHILYNLCEETVVVIDVGIERQLANHADDATLKQMALALKEVLVREYEDEREIIRATAAEFCVFLKKNSLAPYNDALIAYLDHLIKEEQAKVQAGGKRQRLDSLTFEKKKHQEAIEIITRDMDSSIGGDVFEEGGVDRRVKSLYSLKHFGANLKALKQDIGGAYQATYRERPYTVKRSVQSRFEDRRPIRRPSQYQSGSIVENFASMVKKGMKKSFGF